MILHKTVAIVVESNGKLLLVKRANRPERNYWAVIGGHVENGEDIYTAATRETEEEAGKGIEIVRKPLFDFVHDVDIMHRHRCYVFKGKITDRYKLRPGGDAKRIGFFTINQIKRMNITSYTLYIINRLIENGCLRV